MPLAIIILGRDVLLSLSAFYIRYKTLPAPVSSVIVSSTNRADIRMSRKRSADTGTFLFLQQKFTPQVSARYGTKLTYLPLNLTGCFS